MNKTNDLNPREVKTVCSYCKGTGVIQKGNKTKKCKYCDEGNPYRNKTWCMCFKVNSKGHKKCKINKNVCQIL